jgi:hypothetical protein
LMSTYDLLVEYKRRPDNKVAYALSIRSKQEE